jgi:hypothetical protein
MKKHFQMSDLGLLSYYLGIEVKQGQTGLLSLNRHMLISCLSGVVYCPATRARHPWKVGSS